MRRPLAVGTLLAMGAAAFALTVGATPASADDASVPNPGAYVPVGPTRAVDTRVTGGPLGPGATRVVDLSGIITSKTATAAVVNLTVTSPTTAGFLTVFPDGTSRPPTSDLNKQAGETRSNSVTVALPPSGSRRIDVYNDSGSTQVIVDVSGFYDPTRIGSGDAFARTTPSRASDSRQTNPGGVTSGQGYDVVIPTPADTREAVHEVLVNVTAVNATGTGYVRLWSGAGTEPGVSTVNYVRPPAGADGATPNLAIVPVRQDSAGKLHIRVDNVGATVNVIVDVHGYYVAGGFNAYYVPLPPQRLVDTRTGGGPIGPGATLGVGVYDSHGYHDAENVTVTLVDATAPTYVTAYPLGTTRPDVSTLNASSPVAVANAAQPGSTHQSVDGPQPDLYAFTVSNNAGRVNVIVDEHGFFELYPS